MHTLPYDKNMELKTGDILVTSSIVPIIKHFAIVYSKDGQQTVADNVFWSGKVEVSSLEDYKKVRNIIGVMRNTETKSLSDEEIQKKVEEAKKINYRFFSYNCEDFVRRVCGCDIGFDQRKKFIIIILIIIFTILIIKKLSS